MKGEGAHVECSNEQIAALLSDYFSGHLGSTDEERVQTHIVTCTVCRDSLRIMTLMASQGNAGRHSHPSKDTLGLYYHDRARLTPVIAEMVREHLARCKECSAELAILNDLECELRDSVSDTAHEGGKIGQLVSRYGRYVAYAAAACLLLMVGYRVMTTEDQMSPTSVTYRLSESVRSESTLPVVGRTTGTEIIVFEIPYYHARSENNYSVAVTDAQGRATIANASRVDFPQPGLLLVHLPSAALRDGEYRLVLKETKKGTSGDSTQAYFPFRLISTTN